VHGPVLTPSLPSPAPASPARRSRGPRPRPPSPTSHPKRFFIGNVTFKYEISDACIPGGATTTAVVTLTYPSPGGPVASDDAYPCAFNSTSCGPTGPQGILGNDRSLTGGAITVTNVVAQPPVGTVTVQPNGQFTYTPPT
jgi:hypothetical protein